MRWAVAAIAVAAAATTASADGDKPDLKVRRGSIPHHLTMRTAQTSAPTPAPTPATPAKPAPDVEKAAPTPHARDFDLAGVRSANEQIVFRLDLGFGVDGASISGRRAIAGEPLAKADYREVRAQGFGNLFVGTRGLVVAPLSSYLSLGFRLTPSIRDIAPLADALDSTRDVQIRDGWAEATNFLPGRLKSVRVRAGRQYSYGPWPIHFDGSVFAWTSKAFQLSALAGIRVDDYAAQGDKENLPPVAAIIAGVNLGALGRWPITARGTVMWLDTKRFSDLELGYRPRRGIVVVAGVRTIENSPASERATVRAQISEVTNVVVDFERRHDTDWRWDMTYIDPTDPGAARPYLELPPVTPQVRLSARAGTVLLDNIDLLLRGAFALDTGKRPDERTGYAEIGGAFEVRVRRTVAITGSTLFRDYELTDGNVVGTQQTDEGDNQPGPLLDPTDPIQASSMGQEAFFEGGGGLRFSTGARRFSASGEVYLRRAKYALLYFEDTPGVGDTLDRINFYYGGRVSLDGWLTQRFRLHLEYDLSSQIDTAPEINGWKQLRVLAEGSF